jgi:hypothetical protein
MMITLKAKLSTEFLFDPELVGTVWITTGKADEGTVFVPMSDMIEFALRAADVGSSPEWTEHETDEVMRILERLGVFDPRQSREQIRDKLRRRMQTGGLAERRTSNDGTGNN